MLPASTDLLTVSETAAALRVSKPTVYRWIACGYLPAIRYGSPRPEGDARRGGAIRVPAETIAALRASRVTPKAVA